MNQALREAIHGALNQMEQRCTIKERRLIIADIREMMLDANVYQACLIVDDETTSRVGMLSQSLMAIPMKLSRLKEIQRDANKWKELEEAVCAYNRITFTWDRRGGYGGKYIAWVGGQKKAEDGDTLSEALNLSLEAVENETSYSGEDQ